MIDQKQLHHYALIGLNCERGRIERLVADLTAELVPAKPMATAGKASATKQRGSKVTWTDEMRKTASLRMRRMNKKRYGSKVGIATDVATNVATSNATSSAKRVVSAEGRARMAVAQRKRWAAIKKSGKVKKLNQSV